MNHLEKLKKSTNNSELSYCNVNNVLQHYYRLSIHEKYQIARCKKVLFKDEELCEGSDIFITIFLFSCLELDFLLSGCIRENGCQKLNNALNLESSYKWIMINQ